MVDAINVFPNPEFVVMSAISFPVSYMFAIIAL